MAATKHKAYTATIASLLTTEINSLANAANTAVSSEIDNTTNLDLYVDLALSWATSSARTAGAYVAVYIIQCLDGTNYPTINQDCDALLAVFSLDAATTARPDVTRHDCPIPPGKWKVYLRNQTGQAAASSGNLLEYRAHSIESA